MAASVKDLLIIDAEAPYEYCPEDLGEKALGGTESTTLRVACELAKSLTVSVAQGARTSPVCSGGCDFLPLRWKRFHNLPKARIIMVLRNHKLLPRLKRKFPKSRFILWLHCLPGKAHKKTFCRNCLEAEAEVICVSKAHAKELRDFLGQRNPRLARLMKIQTIYNPLDERDFYMPRRVNPNKLLFISSPHKGLEQVLENFRYLKERFPELELHVANPGYMADRRLVEFNGVVSLGRLTRREVIRHLSECLCLFYPQNQFSETFGLVLAEANACGAPALAHDLGAAREVLGQDLRQLVDAENKEDILARIKQWRKEGAPKTKMNKEFRLEKVIEQWKKLLISS